MSGPPGVAERVVLSVKGGVEDWKEQLKFLLQTLKTQPGYVRTRWGPWEEDMQKLDLIIGWKTAEDSATFGKSADFAAAMAKMAEVQGATPPAHYFVHFKPFAPREGLDSPFVEMITITNCKANEDELRATIEKAKGIEGTNACACGYSPDAPDTFVAVVAWQGLDISRAADKSAYIPAGVGEVETHHVNFRFPIKGFRGL